jgi:hypothetical protein
MTEIEYFCESHPVYRRVAWIIGWWVLTGYSLDREWAMASSAHYAIKDGLGG